MTGFSLKATCFYLLTGSAAAWFFSAAWFRLLPGLFADWFSLLSGPVASCFILLPASVCCLVFLPPGSVCCQVLSAD
jgi:hypothetical protein